MAIQIERKTALLLSGGEIRIETDIPVIFRDAVELIKAIQVPGSGPQEIWFINSSIFRGIFFVSVADFIIGRLAVRTVQNPVKGHGSLDKLSRGRFLTIGDQSHGIPGIALRPDTAIGIIILSADLVTDEFVEIPKQVKIHRINIINTNFLIQQFGFGGLYEPVSLFLI